MSNPTPSITVAVDPTNPGQFFACCGLLELADRLWPGAEGWFGAEGNEFHVTCDGTLRNLLESLHQLQFAELEVSETEGEDEEESDDHDDETTPVKPLLLTAPIQAELNWWGDKGLKPWAGSMNAAAISLAMARGVNFESSDPFNYAAIVCDADTTVVKNGKTITKKGKPREPFYFDARRGSNVKERDVGFTPDALKKKYKINSYCYPAVEILAFIGLQRGTPTPTSKPRVYEYCTWTIPLTPCVLLAGVNGNLGDKGSRRFLFSNPFRTGKKQHKAYIFAITLSQSQGE